MISLTVTATLRSPVHLGAKNTSAYFLAGLGHIPGRALLGAAAWAWIDRGGDPQTPEFARRFVSGDVSWGDLHPLVVDPKTGAATDNVPTVEPRTVKVCKLFGFEHGRVDTLLHPHALDACEHLIDGRPCGVGRKRLEYVPRRQLRTHLAIGFDTGTARSGYLYSREVLEEGQVFRGEIHCADEPTAAALVADLPGLPLAVGGGRSRGYGEIDVQVERGAAPSLSAEELKVCSEYIAARRGLAPADARYFTLTAASPWFLREPDDGHARSLTPRWLARLMGIDQEMAKVLDGDARSEARSGWDGAANLPTEVRHVILAGSTFLCGITSLDDRALCARLTRLLERGIGGYRAEGLGRVIVNHPLHFSAEANRDK